MRVLMTKVFARWARKEMIAHLKLLAAVNEIEAGLIDARLGGGLIKKRIARTGSGKRGSYRSIIAYRHAAVVIFLFGFAKSDRDTLDSHELELFRTLATDLLSKPDLEFDEMVADELLVEVKAS
jgi:hypothetical protein